MSYICDNVLSVTNTTEMVAGIIIPPQPIILMQVMKELTKSNGGCVHSLAALVAKDLGLSAAILKTINSSLYGLPKEVKNIEHAIDLLGQKNIRTITTSFSLRKIQVGQNLENYWFDNGRTVMVANFLCRRFDDIDIDDINLYSLFHDAGQILMHQRFGSYAKMLKFSAEPDQNIIELENTSYHTDHMLIGSLLARAWGLPKSIRTAIGRHHDLDVFATMSMTTAELNMIAITNLAEYIIANGDTNFTQTEWSVYHQELMNYLGINDVDMVDIFYDIDEFIEEHKSDF